MSLRAELETLFGKLIVKRSQKVEPERVDALAVQAAAGALLRLKADPSRQVHLVATMNPDTAAALCRWLADPAFWGLVGTITKH